MHSEEDRPTDLALESVLDSLLRCPANEREAELQACNLGAGGQDYLRLLTTSSEVAMQRVSAQLSPRSVPAEVAGYAIGRRLGGGGLATVYEAEAPGKLPRVVAVKVMRPSLPSHLAERLLRHEAFVLRHLAHRSIPRFYGREKSGQGSCSLLMQHIDGTPLLEVCRSQTPSLDQRIGLVRQLCDVVQHVHDAGFVHCDVKPENILISEAGRPYLVDFGSARKTRQSPALPVTATPGYASPELLRHQPVGPQADVYGLGSLLHSLCFPLALDRPACLLRSQDGDRDPDNQKISLVTELSRIVRRTLRLRPEDRYSSAAELAEDLDELERLGCPASSGTR